MPPPSVNIYESVSVIDLSFLPDPASSASSNPKQDPSRLLQPSNRNTNMTQIDLVKPLNANQQFIRNGTDIDIIKLPLYCPSDKVYDSSCEGRYFRNMTHYRDDWSAIAGTKWYTPDKIAGYYRGKHARFKYWRYDIVNYPIIPNYRTSNKSRDDIRITIVTQSSLDRINLIEFICQKWTGVISVTIYIRLEESIPKSLALIDALHQRAESQYSALLDISILFESQPRDKDGFDKGLMGVMYPVNHARNIALQCARTELVLLSDGDFMPSENFHDRAVQQFATAAGMAAQYNFVNKSSDRSDMVALIVPAFEFGSSYSRYSGRMKRKKKKDILQKE